MPNIERNPAANVLYALTLPARAAALIARQPRLLGWCALPALLTLAIYASLVGVIHAESARAIAWITFQLGLAPHGIGAMIIQGLLALVLILGAAVTFSYTATLLATPFADFLAEATEVHTPLAPLPTRNFSRTAPAFSHRRRQDSRGGRAFIPSPTFLLDPRHWPVGRGWARVSRRFSISLLRANSPRARFWREPRF